MKNLATKNANDFTITQLGGAYVSQRKLAEIIDVPVTSISSTIIRHLSTVQPDRDQGLNPEMVTKCVQYFSAKGKPKAIEFLGLLAEAGAKAWMYHEAGYQIDAVVRTPQTLAEALRLAADKAEENEKLRLMVDNTFGYSSIIRAAQHVGIHESKFNYRVLKAMSIKMGLPPKNVPSPRFKYQLLYPLQAFKESYPEYDFDDLKPQV